MVWLLLLLGLAVLILVILAGRRRTNDPPSRPDRRGSGAAGLDGAPIIGPDDDGFGLADGWVIRADRLDDDPAEDARRVLPGGGSGGGAGASAGWDEDDGAGDDAWDGGDD